MLTPDVIDRSHRATCAWRHTAQRGRRMPSLKEAADRTGRPDAGRPPPEAERAPLDAERPPPPFAPVAPEPGPPRR